MSDLAEWDSFYVIVGGAAGALIGLQFVVMTLIADRPPPRAAEAAPAFSTPTTIHFSSVLLLAALTRVPWWGPAPLAWLWLLIGIAGLIYMVIVTRRMRRQTAYKPDIEDLLGHAIVPLLAYALIVVAAVVAFTHLYGALFAIGAAALLLLFVGIHNAWDAIAFHVFRMARKDTDGGP